MAKYKVGDWVKVIPPPQRKDMLLTTAHILEVCVQTCEAGIEQVVYRARLWRGGSSSSAEIVIREMELGEIIKENEK